MAGFFYALYQELRICQQLEATVGTTKWLALKKKPITTRAEKYIKDYVYWKRLYDLLRAIWPVLKLLKIDHSSKPGMDQLCHLSYKAHCETEKSKEHLDDVTLFVRSLINPDDEADATYSES